MSPVVIIPKCDGSPPTEAVVHAARQIVGEVIVIQAQGGKGLALKQGVTRAAEMSFTHAITMDGDGRHSPDDLKKFLEAINQNPNVIIVGVRQGLPQSIRIARAHCDFWVWTATGKWIHDTPNGYRAFPLSLISDLSLRCDQFDFEIEVLVKSIWAGGDVIEIPVSPAGESQLIPFSDAARLGWLMTVLISQRLLLPSPLLGQIHKKEFADLPLSQRVRRISRDAILLNSDQPRSFAACIGLGVFFGILPIWGFQMLAAAAAAHALRLSKPLVLAASNISSPITIPFILYLSLIIGHLLHRGQLEGLPSLHDLRRPMILGEYIAGSIVLAIAAGIIAGLLAYAAASALKAAPGKTRMLNRSTARWATGSALMFLTPVIGTLVAIAVLKCLHKQIPTGDLPLGIALICLSINYAIAALNRPPQPNAKWTRLMQSPSITVPLATIAAVLCAWFLDGQEIALFAAIGLAAAAMFTNLVLPKFSLQSPTSTVYPHFQGRIAAVFTVVLLSLCAIGIARLRAETHGLLLLTTAGLTEILIVITVLLVRVELVAAAIAPIIFSVVLALGALGLAGIEITRYNSIFILFLLGLTTDFSVNTLWSRLETFRGRSSANPLTLKLAVILAACLLASTAFVSFRPAAVIGLIVVISSMTATLLSSPITNWLLPTDSHRPAPSLSNSGGAKSLYNYLDIDAEQYVTWKLRLDPIFKGIDSAVPPAGQILDAGCGFGQMSNSLALQSGQRTVIGVDRDQRKIEIARCAARTLSNAHFEVGDLLEWQYPPSDCVLLVDVLHYWNPEKQQQIIAKAAACLRENGTLIFREGLASSSLAHRLVHFGERWSTWTGQNRRGDGLFFQDRDFYLKTFRQHGLSLQKEVPEWGPGSNSVLILHRPSGA